jgi:cytochrome P450
MADIQFNPMDPEFVADPYPTYHRLRAEDPVHHSPLGFWVLTRYADVMGMLRDPRLIKEPIAAFVAARFGMAIPPGLGLSMLDRDPPDHTRLRGLVSKAFTPKALESLRPHIQQIVDGLLAQVEGRGEMDLIEEFAYPLPVVVICEMLGVPVADQERFKGWGLDIARGLDAIMLPPDSEVAKRSVAGRHALSGYFR